MKVLGEKIGGLNFSVCNAFKPTILDEEVCYALNIKDLISNGSIVSKLGKGEGLLLAIDNGISIETRDKSIVMKQDFIRTKPKTSGKKISFHILTLHHHEVFRHGIYTLEDLKQITGTDNFLAMPDAVKKCQIEPKEECRRRRYVLEVQRRCRCVPWSLSTVLLDQEVYHFNHT